MTRHFHGEQEGFTIIELMIATAVLSTILLLTTIVMMSIGTLYYKGINQSRVQDDVRTITDQLSQDLELGDTDPIHVSNGTTQAYCINDARFTYILYTQIGSGAGQSQHVLWRDTNPAPGSCSTMNLPVLNSTNPDSADPSLNGTELIAPNSRLISFSITGVPPTGTSPYNVSVGVAYGGDDLICDSGYAGDCNTGTESTQMMNIIAGAGSVAPDGPIICKGTTGQEYCAAASSTITVARRLTP
jgi:prepilin-type N-terminal cleavage/methylation domain-containing protein